MKKNIIIGISILLNIFLITELFAPKKSDIPPFEPFHNITEVEYEDMLEQNFEQIPVDVLMLGKTEGNLSIAYQFNDDGKCVWRNSIINLDTKIVDTLGIYRIIESYNADIISTYQNASDFDKPELTEIFFVQHRTNNVIFECRLDSVRTGNFEISCSFSPPLTDNEKIQDELSFWKSRKRFGPDTTIYEDGKIHIENYFNWQLHGEDKWLRSDSSIETVRFYNQGVNTKTLIYYQNGQLKSNVLAYNQTGDSRWFYPDGTLKEIIQYKEGERFGEHIKYYPNGIIEFKGSYDSGNEKKGFYDSGIKHGKWNYFDSLGILLNEEMYEYGLKI